MATHLQFIKLANMCKRHLSSDLIWEGFTVNKIVECRNWLQTQQFL